MANFVMIGTFADLSFSKSEFFFFFFCSNFLLHTRKYLFIRSSANNLSPSRFDVMLRA